MTRFEDRTRRGDGRRVLLLVLLLAVTGLPSLATGQTIQALATFGDNVADPGNIPGLLAAGNAAGQGPFDTNFPPSPPYFGNRFSNGPVAVEYLAGLLGVPAGGVDHRAVGNAFSAPLPVILTGGTIVGNGGAIPAPVGRQLTPLNETDVANQVSRYLAARPALGPDDLMVIYASANDGALALNTTAALGLTGEAALATIQGGAVTNGVNTAASAGRLIDAGAQQVVLVLLPDIGQTPAAQAGGLAGSAAGTLFSEVSNATVRAEAARLNANTNAVVSVFDSATLLSDIVANPAKYGLVNVDTPCLLVAECVGDPALADQFLFWDEFFPTTAVHAITAAALADTVNAPKTLAAQAEAPRLAATQFTERLLAAQGASGLWLDYERSEWRRDGETFAFGYDADFDRLTLGWRNGAGAWRFAAALGVERGDIRHRGIDAGFDLDSLRFGLAAGRSLGNFEFDVAASLGDDDLDDVFRVTGVASQIARADTDGDTYAVLAQLALPLERGSLLVTPALRLGRAEADVDGYTEAGAVALEQIVASRESTSSFAELGIRLAAASSEARFQPSAGLYYHADFSDDEQRIASSLVSAPDVVRSFDLGVPDDDYFRLDAGFVWRLGTDLDLRVALEGIEGADRLDGWRIGLGLGWRW
ncbi:MAG: SGNH/GDSL hydrolase family protein [Pseudomonadota bacterium]